MSFHTYANNEHSFIPLLVSHRGNIGMVRTLVFALSFLWVLPSFAGESSLIAQHKNWGSRVIKDGTSAVFRAFTWYEDKSDRVILTLDRYPNDCDTVYARMNIALSKKLTDDFEVPNRSGAMQVDEYPVHKISYTVSGKTGANIFFVTITDFENGDTLFAEIIKGQILRFKMPVAKDALYLRFSLLGSTAALTRTKDLCTGFAQENSDERYFKGGGTARNDETDFKRKSTIRTDEKYF
jgi:hypothetical protein